MNMDATDSTADLDAQIAALERLKAQRLAAARERQLAADRERANVLVDVTPTKSKVVAEAPPSPPKQPQFRTAAHPPPQPGFKRASSLLASKPLAKPTPKDTLEAFTTQVPRASGLAAALAKRRAGPQKQALPSLERSTGFGQPRSSTAAAGASGSTAAAAAAAAARIDNGKGKGKGKEKEVNTVADDEFDGELEVVRTGTERDADLCVENDIPLGPGTFGPDPEGENEWRSLEPNSGIRLSKRVLPHAEVQENLLYGRYHLRPPQIYSVARLSRDGATYDVPVDGDWVTIAVVAERGEIRVSGMKDVASDDDDDEGEQGVEKKKSKLAAAKDKSATKGKKDDNGEKKRKRQPRKYINLKLVALPPRSKTLGGGMSSSATGDAMLQLLLFEADSIIHADDGNGGSTRTYRGGSGGAYERWCNLGVGSVIAILNPRILRPLKSGGATPHPLTLPLALNPQSADSITLIGHAMDIGRCTALQRDGSRCKAWVDTRVGAVCEYHVHAAVKRGRASRAEFASATTSYELETRARGSAPSRFGSSGSSGNGGDYDSYNPRQKRGLLPRAFTGPAPRSTPAAGGGGATYVVGSGIARTGSGDALPAFGDAHLAERLGRSQDARRKRKAEALEAEAALAKILERTDDCSVGAKYLAALGKRDTKKEGQGGVERKRVFHAAAIKRIGFDPTGVRDEDPDKRGAAILSLKEASNKPLRLGRPPGPKRLSNVVVPPSAVTAAASAHKDEDDGEEMIDLD